LPVQRSGCGSSPPCWCCPTEISGALRARVSEVLAELRERLKGRPVYLCFDMDVFDPSCAPGVATPSWGGLSAREGIEFLRGLVGLDIIAVDVNTVSPPHDVQNMTAFLAAQVIYESLVLLCQKPS